MTGPNGTAQNGVSEKRYMPHSEFLSQKAKNQPDAPIRSMFAAERIPGMISFLAGKPNDETFPWKSIQLKLAVDPEGYASDGKPAEEVTLDINGADLSDSLQYNQTYGLPRLNAWLTDFVSKLHDRPIIAPDQVEAAAAEGRTPWRLTIGNGSQDLIHKTMAVILDPEDTVLTESPAYAGALPLMGQNIVGVDGDEQGVSSELLRKVLANWKNAPETSSKKFPKALYTIPTGSNPAGTTATEERKRQVLAIAREYEIYVLEDDAYFFLSFVGLGENPATRYRPKSYFALEAEDRERWGDGRVLRFDSFSKVLSAGCRCAYLSGPRQILDSVDRFTASWNLQPSGPPQALVLATLEHWGVPGFLRHADRVATFYQKRRDHFEGEVRRILGEDSSKKQKAVAEWVSPKAGMFLFLTLKLPKSLQDAKPLAERALKKGCLALPGSVFMPNTTSSPTLRLSFSLIPLDEIEEGLRRLREAIEEVWTESGEQL